MTTVPDNDERDVDWLITSFARRIPGVSSVLVLSTDGLVLAASERLDRETAETLAAVTSGLTSLTAGAARHLGAGNVLQVIVEMDGGFLFLSTISEGSALAVVCASDADIGQIGYEMSVLVSRVGQVLTPALRAELSARRPT
ncbi:MAG TPA: roadblock/LC7 domain-containing protein [Acidimicrobiales bacterium]|nr:roadblock/LC7 domain-containing protein [Acidimicrobiales bacterium]